MNRRTKLDPAEHRIRERVAAGELQRDVAASYGMSEQRVSQIVRSSVTKASRTPTTRRGKSQLPPRILARNLARPLTCRCARCTFETTGPAADTIRTFRGHRCDGAS